MNTNRPIELIAAVAATLMLLACSIPTEGLSLAVTQRQRFVPPEEYRGWWETVEACSFRLGDFDLVRWYQADVIVIEGKDLNGFWESPHDITVVKTAKGNTSVVRHEMLHDLLHGDPDHEHEAWSHCGLGNQGGP